MISNTKPFLSSSDLFDLAIDFELKAASAYCQYVSKRIQAQNVLNAPKQYTAWGLDRNYEIRRFNRYQELTEQMTTLRCDAEDFRRAAKFNFDLAVKTEYAGQ